MTGELFCLEEDEDITLARSHCKACLPSNLEMIDEQFKKSLIGLYEWKVKLVK
jgi:hypothetical protein